jgi:preprotein translocase subunit SecA
MGTLVAEREAGTNAFTDPEGFLDTLVSTGNPDGRRAATIRRAQAENAGATVSSLIDRVLRLPAERRRRLAEAKLQEVQTVLDQAIKAHALFNREVNYVIDGGREIVIVDEFTGRKMPGRRFSEGLHEALEAKHGLEVQLESQTVATITIQNYFRLYNKLAGMTGTAKTEEAEFAKTYGIEVISIPTNKQIQRRDYPDVVYKTSEAKFRAITFEVLEHHCAGKPVLVGTRSVEVSEQMSERLKAQPLQTLVLTQLIKSKLWDDKSTPAEQKTEIIAGLNTPIGQINPLQVKALAKQLGINPDPANEENVNTLLSLFTIPNPSRERLESVMRVGLPHNVLNAKNHRNEARIVAEAARPASVTIATNMAGRGVDIVLGGTLDVESRWRVMTLQTLARHLEGKSVHVRSRNEETTQKFVERLAPERLQDLAWLSAVTQRVDELEADGTIQGQAAKELRDTLVQELTTPDLKNKVRSRARRLNLLEQWPLDAEPLSDNRVLDAINNDLGRLMGKTFDNAALQAALAKRPSRR